MIRILKRIADWLDKRFPPRVTVTEEKFVELEERLRRCARDAAEFQGAFAALTARLKTAEESVSALKELLAKSGSVAAVSEKRRADFIANGRMGE